VPLLFTLFCFKGFDNRLRFLLCALASIIGFVLLSKVFSNSPVFVAITLLLTSIVLALSSRRRLRDANHLSAIQILPSILLLVYGFLTLVINNNYIDYLFIAPLLSVVYFLSYPTHPNNHKIEYIFGYAGPIDLSIYKKISNTSASSNKRIEPKLVSLSSEQDLLTEELQWDAVVNQGVSKNNNSNDLYLQTDKEFNGVTCQADINNDISSHKSVQPEQYTFKNLSTTLHSYWLNNSKLRLSVIVTLLLIFGFILINAVISAFTPSKELNSEADSKNIQTQAVTNKINAINIIDKQYLLAMPDNFNLYLSQYQGLIIHWQADESNVNQLWSQLSNQGDKSCQQITFNRGKSIRPLSVNVENSNDYFANFSPLDTAELIKALAFRADFSLCGYNFSLKGSQALLGKHNQYALFLEQAD
jgi:hypothetical protein